ncbi:N-acetyl-gamma-glutamyl-phosphate reductase [Salibacterium halotolerans]|uniref:N-acetyl-gamma-glutamyl-phosphate reductase n=1 Tax=Salibacterium halotolerans TaxID=1884432 RepID=A0A1I5T7I8_9BACI|nr:N-acetyl-gamma-glutamyl-phosphate reductase [Salibacterium halotolerans]SFP78995.1 N-acetyl-gamma-glutamyl-phosphate reductase [Salibacterium halotolerans]
MRAAIVGATGYGGIELIRLLHNHPEIESMTVFSSSQEGKQMAESFPHVTGIVELTLEDIDAKKLKQHDVVFLSTPPGVSAELSTKLNGQTRIIDLSGDLRLKHADTYRSWYKRESAPDTLLQEAVYGLTEWHREEVTAAVLLSNPGCYATTVLSGILPLIKEEAADAGSLIIDAKSGTTGAGRSPSAMTHFSEMNDNLKIYKVNEHKHTPEIEQELARFSKKEEPVTFSPHLVPMTRGIMATMYVPLARGWNREDLEELFEQCYRDSPFIRIRKDGALPFTKEVYGTNYCDIGFTVDERTGRATIVSVTDNLMKGASGQAVQNMNLMFGLPETSGLDYIPMYP